MPSSILYSQDQQNFRVNGIVKDVDGMPIPAVNVIEKGTKNGIQTDFDGKFTIETNSGDAVLIFSSVGLQTKQVKVNSKSRISVVMQTDIASLDEVVVVGYGTQKKSDVTGAVSSVDQKSYDKVIKTTASEGLRGLASGVRVTSSSSQPGGGVNIRIRGFSSINASTQPLFVIDGVAIDNTGEATGESDGPTLSPLANINPNDIESIDILKDASSTAIYGARGSNGVVIITTKSGQEGKARFSVDISSGVQKIAKTLDLMNAQQYLEAKNLVIFNDSGRDLEEAQQQDGWFSDEYIANAETVDWQDKIFRTGNYSNIQASASGGRNGGKYYFSLGRNVNNGVIKGSNFERTSIRVNSSQKFNKKFEVGQHINFALTNADAIRTETANQSGPAASVIFSALRYSPVKGDSYDPDNDFIGDEDNPNLDNPIALVEDVTNVKENQRLNGDVYASFEPIKSLMFKTIGGYDFSNSTGNLYSPRTTRKGRELNGIAKISIKRNKRYTSTNSVQYTPQLGENHDVTFLGVYEINKNEYNSYFMEATGFNNDILRENKIQTALNPGVPRNDKRETGLVSYLGRLNYNFKRKYLLTASFRRDGSSQLVKNRWANFPSVAIAWRASKEKFLRNNNIISNLKFRASYGVVGNQSIPSYSTFNTYTSGFYVLGDRSAVGFFSNSLPNPNLKWETKKQLNLGMDYSLFENRISGSVEYYNDRTDNLLFSREIPLSTGYVNMLDNLGSVENSGLEVSLSSYNIDTDHFSWTTDLNFSLPRNKILELAGTESVLAGISNTNVKNSQILQVGEPIGQFYGFIKTGIAKTEEDLVNTRFGTMGGYTYKDLSGPEGVPDGIIDQNDKTVIGNALPKFYGGITNTLSYKNFTFSFFFQGQYGNDIMNLNKTRIEWSKISGNQLATVSTDAWDPETNPDGTLRQLRTHGAAGEDANSRLIEDGSYLRLENVSLNYRIPGLNKMNVGIENLTIYLSANNLLTLTKYSGYDPEVDSRSAGATAIGHDYFGYPKNKTMLVGMRFNL